MSETDSVYENKTQNQRLADDFDLIAHYLILDDEKYRAGAFRIVADKIRNYDGNIISGQQAKEVLGRGVGDSSMDIIDEYLRTGSIQRLRDLEEKHRDAKDIIDYFQSFYGIGPKTAIKLYNENYRTLSDIWHSGMLNSAQQKGIMWREHLEQKIPRHEMDAIKDIIASKLDPYGIRWDIAGSYRRGEASSGDIDILVQTQPDLNMEGIILLLQDILPESLAQGETKYMGIVRIDEQHYGHRIDIRLIEPESYAYALLYFTGSQQFNILCRQRAISMGLRLNEYGLYNAEGASYPANTEEEIFAHLNLPYIAPIDRKRDMITL